MSTPNKELPDAEARAQALDLGRHALVMAPAGSGKTGLLVHRFLLALATVEYPEQVVAITFTNKAAAEIRARVIEVLEAAETETEPNVSVYELALREAAQAVASRDREKGWALRHQPGRLNALTIDAFCAQLAGRLPLSSGLGGSVGIADDPRGLYLDAIQRLFAEIEDASVPQNDRDALARVLAFSGNRLDRLIDPLCSLIETREQWLAVVVNHDTEFWAKLDAQLLGPILDSATKNFGDALGEQDLIELSVIFREGASRHEKLAHLQDLSEIPESVENLRAIADQLLTSGGGLRKPGGINVTFGFEKGADYTKRFKSFLEARAGDDNLEAAAKGMLSAPDKHLSSEMQALRLAWLRVLRRLAGHLRLGFAERQQADFSELSQSALRALFSDGDYSDAMMAAEHRIRHLLVDEMQDTSETQVSLVSALTESWADGDGRSLFLVGDPQQSIYAFRAARVGLFLELWEARRLGVLSLNCLRLSANFRSRPGVVDWFNQAFERVFPARADAMRGAVEFSPSVAMRAPDPSQHGEPVMVWPYTSRKAEANAAACQAQDCVNLGGTVAVLARTRRDLEPVIQALKAKGVSTSCQDIDPLSAMPQVRDVIHLALALWHPEDRLSWAVVLRAPFVGLSWKHLTQLSRGCHRLSWPERIRRALDERRLDGEGLKRLERLQTVLDETAEIRSLRANLAGRTEAVWHRLGGPACCDRASLEDVRRAVRCLKAEVLGGVIEDLDRLHRSLERLFAAPRAGQVQLMTIHKAKGLEFDHVLIVGMNRSKRNEDSHLLSLTRIDGTTLVIPQPDDRWPNDDPARRSYGFVRELQSEAANNEQLRLLYVAITRARASAHLFFTAERDSKTRKIKLVSRSFAGTLAPVILDQADRALEVSESAIPNQANEELETLGSQPPRAPRLPLGFELPEEAGLYRPVETRTLRPSEAVLDAASAADENSDQAESGDLYAQLVGTVFHEALERVTQEGVSWWEDASETRRRSMLAGLRRRGMPEPLVEGAVDRVVELMAVVLSSDTGKWLIKPRSWSRSEYPLAGMREGRWISAVIDRCFVDEQDGNLWVVDYKTRAEPTPEDEIERYVADSAAKYQRQIEHYVSLIAELRPDQNIRGALYLVDVDRLVEIAGP